MRYVCTRTCTDFSGRYWEAGAVADFAEGERVPTWFSPLEPAPLPEPTAGEAAEPPKPHRPRGKK